MGGVVKVQGIIDGQTVNIDQSPASGELSQVSTGALAIPIHVTFNDAAVVVDPGIVQVNLMWATVVPDGSPAAATGTITLPPGGPYARMSLCVGAGSSITVSQGGADFVLTGLTLGPACTHAVAGELDGCWGNSF
nr:hypothetical protein Hi04_10k_c4996_00019 [uncultured bacterium]